MSDDPRHRLDHELYRSLFESRTIVLGEPLEDRNSNRLCHALLLLAAEDPRSRHPSCSSTLRAARCPACWPSATACTRCRTTWCTVNLGMAYSAGQFLLSAGTRGRRYACRTRRCCCTRDRAGSGARRWTSPSRPTTCATPGTPCWACIAEDTGQPVAQVERGLAARPLVHRRGGEGLRVRRRRRGVCWPTSSRTPASRWPVGPGGGAMSSYAIPYVTLQTTRGERTVDIYSRLLADRIVYLGTGIDDGVANAVIAQLLHLENENPEAPVSLYLNSSRRVHPGDARHLRRDAVHPAPGRDHLRRAGRRDRRPAARGRHERAPEHPAPRAGGHPRAGGGGSRHRARPDPARPTRWRGSVRCRRRSWLRTRAGPRPRCARTPNATSCSTRDAAVGYGVVDAVLPSRALGHGYGGHAHGTGAGRAAMAPRRLTGAASGPARVRSSAPARRPAPPTTGPCCHAPSRTGTAATRRHGPRRQRSVLRVGAFGAQLVPTASRHSGSTSSRRASPGRSSRTTSPT